MPVELGPAFLAGIALVLGGAAAAALILMRSGVFAPTRSGLRFSVAVGRLLARDDASRVKWMLGTASFVALLGGFVTCGSIFVDDDDRNTSCQQACRGSGFDSGRFRGNPHVERPHADIAYGCYCQDERGWAREALELHGSPDAN